MKTKEQILKWLEEEGISQLFFENANKTTQHNLKYDGGLITRAFIWSNTKQGHAFWEMYDDRYHKFYNSEEQSKEKKEMEKQLFKVGDIVYIKKREGGPDEYAYTFTDEMTRMRGFKYRIKYRIYSMEYATVHDCKYPDDGYRYYLETEDGYKSGFTWASSMLEFATINGFVKRKHNYKLNFKN